MTTEVEEVHVGVFIGLTIDLKFGASSLDGVIEACRDSVLDALVQRVVDGIVADTQVSARMLEVSSGMLGARLGPLPDHPISKALH